MARQLASVQRIENLEPIPGADQIERATVLGWQLVVKKNEFSVGSLCVYVEIDSIMPDRPEFEFLRERKFRVRTIKLRGQVSQGIAFPMSILPDKSIKPGEAIGTDVTELLGVVKYEPNQDEQVNQKQVCKFIQPPWMPKWLGRLLFKYAFTRNLLKRNSGQKSFPSLIPKTDETRVQVLQALLTKYKGTPCYYTEKLDGSSITIYQINGKFGVCSRNIDLKRDAGDKFWRTVVEHDLERKLKQEFGKENIALQGELIGPGIQGNKYKLDRLDIYFFNVYFIRDHAYDNIAELMEACYLLKEKIVPVLNDNYILSDSIPELVELSKGESQLHKTLREGIVIRPLIEMEDSELHCQLVRNRVSFKSVNPDFLLKYND